MSIIITQKGNQAIKLQRSAFENEEKLQEYIFENPDSLPVNEIKGDMRLLMLAREFPTESGPIDALGVDRNGDIYIIETKLSKNTDKRAVVAQVLDYGAALWQHHDTESFLRQIEAMVRKKFKTELHGKLQDFFGLTGDEASDLLENVRSNYSAGRFRFVVLMDRLSDSLKDLIRFLNRKSGLAIYAVEMEYYKFDSYEIVIPKLFGAESVDEAKFTEGAGGRKRWNEDLFFEDVQQRLSAGEVGAVKKLYDYVCGKTGDISWGTGKVTGSFSPKFQAISVRSPFTMYSDGTLQLSFEWLNDDQKAETFRERWRKELMSQLDFPINGQTRYKNLLPSEWNPKVSEFIKVFDSLLNEI